MRQVVAAPAGASSSPGLPSVSALPVVSRLAATAVRGDSSTSTHAGASEPTSSAPARRVDDAPTLGAGLAQNPLAVQRAPLTGRTALPAEPTVQRVEFLAPQIGTASSPPMSPVPSGGQAGPGVRRRIGGESGRRGIARPRLRAGGWPPGPAGGATFASGASGPSAVPAESRMAALPQAPHPGRPAGVQRFALEGPSPVEVDASPLVGGAAETTGPAAPIEPVGSMVPPDLPAVTGRHDRHEPSDPGSPAVSAEPWVAPSASGAQPVSVQAISDQGIPCSRSGRAGASRPDLGRSGSFGVGRTGVRGVPVPAGRIEPDDRRRSADPGAAQCRPPDRSRFGAADDSGAAGRFAPGGGERPLGGSAYGREHVLREHVRVNSPGGSQRGGRRLHQRATSVRRHRYGVDRAGRGAGTGGGVECRCGPGAGWSRADRPGRDGPTPLRTAVGAAAGGTVAGPRASRGDERCLTRTRAVSSVVRANGP